MGCWVVVPMTPERSKKVFNINHSQLRFTYVKAKVFSKISHLFDLQPKIQNLDDSILTLFYSSLGISTNYQSYTKFYLIQLLKIKRSQCLKIVQKLQDSVDCSSKFFDKFDKSPANACFLSFIDFWPDAAIKCIKQDLPQKQCK